MNWIQQNPVIATALIAALGALTGGIVASAAKFVFDFYLSERIKRRWQIVDTKRQYSAPLIRAVEDLRGRITNIDRNLADGAATRWFQEISDEEKKNIPFKRYYFSSTVYLFCKLIAWIEILKREQIFLEFASTRETRRFNSHLERIYSMISYAHLTGTDRERSKQNHWIYYHYLGGIGESLFVKEEGGLLRCMTYHEFCLNYRNAENADFRNWMSEVERCFVDPVPSGASLRSHLPPVPRAKRPSVEKLKSRNKVQIDRMPWTLGLVEAMGAIELVSRLNLETKNRISLILLDSNFEIALKEFIVHQADLFPPSTYNNTKIAQIFQRRHLVLDEIKSKVRIPADLINKAEHYYGLRNKLVHERATVDVADRDIRNYRSVVAKVLKLLFDLNVPDH